jgi:hypothetical protein
MVADESTGTRYQDPHLLPHDSVLNCIHALLILGK